jgi:hypothetical protein
MDQFIRTSKKGGESKNKETLTNRFLSASVVSSTKKEKKRRLWSNGVAVGFVFLFILS